jgi:hypothetical protein
MAAKPSLGGRGVTVLDLAPGRRGEEREHHLPGVRVNGERGYRRWVAAGSNLECGDEGERGRWRNEWGTDGDERIRLRGRVGVVCGVAMER